MTRKKASTVRAATGYDAVLADVVALIDAGRRAVVRTSNAIAKLETFLLELGGDFTFVGRQRRLRVGDAWYPSTWCSSIADCAASSSST